MATPTERDPLLRTSNVGEQPLPAENLDKIKPLFKSTHREVLRDFERDGGSLGFLYNTSSTDLGASNNKIFYLNKPSVLTRGAVFRRVRSETKQGPGTRLGYCLCCLPVCFCAALFSNWSFACKCIETTYTGVEKLDGYLIDDETTKKLRERDFQLLGLNYSKLSEGIEEYVQKPGVDTYIASNHTYTPLFFDKSKLKGFLIFPNKDLSKVIYKPAFDPDTGAPATTAQVHLMAQKACEDY